MLCWSKQRSAARRDCPGAARVRGRRESCSRRKLTRSSKSTCVRPGACSGRSQRWCGLISSGRTMRGSGRFFGMPSPTETILALESAAMDDLAILGELNRNYIRSVQEADVGWFREHLTSDFLNSNPDGSLVDRAGFLEQIARPVTIAGLQAQDVRI